MILSMSRREDMPKYGVPRVFEALEKYKGQVECAVLWTKDPAPLLKVIDQVEVPYYFQYTVVYYQSYLHPNLPGIDECISTFKTLVDKVGNRVIWRYDPIVFTDRIRLQFHLDSFKYIAVALKGYTDRCVVSLLDNYSYVGSRMKALGVLVQPPSTSDIDYLCDYMTEICASSEMEIVTCSEPFLKRILPGKCIDDAYILSHLGVRVEGAKDPKQRLLCGCVKSVDVGVYGSCKHGCAYCYATR